METFFVITPNTEETGLEWAKRLWDTYSFDYDTERTGETVFAWALDSDASLAKALETDGIEFETFQGDSKELFSY